MPQHTHAPGHICAHCDGFPVVHVTTGTRRPDGTRTTLRAACPACNGTGHTPARPVLATVGR